MLYFPPKNITKTINLKYKIDSHPTNNIYTKKE